MTDQPRDTLLSGICSVCPLPNRLPACRIGALLARMERPKGLFRIKTA